MKKICLSILIFIFILSMYTKVNASTGSVEISSDSATVTKGNTFNVSIVGSSDSDITALEAKLSFDNTKLAIQSKSAGKNFTDLSGSDSEIAVLSTGNTSEKQGTIYTITFKVLDNAEVGNTTISISNVTLAVVNSNAEQENLELQVKGLDVEIKEASDTNGNTANDNTNDDTNGNTANDNTNDNANGNTANGNTNDNANGNTANGNTNDDTDGNTANDNVNGGTNGNTTNNGTNDNANDRNSANNSNTSTKDTTAISGVSKLPRTGVGNIILIIAIAILIILAISYIGYNKYKDIK